MKIDVSGLTRSSSAASELGTALHEVGEKVLLGKLKLASAAGKTFNGVKITRQQIDEIVKPYIDFVHKHVEPHSELLVEHKARVLDDCWGTADVVIITPDLSDPRVADIKIIDLKTGAGQKVSPVNNSQLAIYAAGVIRDVEVIHDIRSIEVGICQPPHNVFALQQVPLKKIKAFEGEVIKTIEDIEKGVVRFVPSEDNCRWCPAASLCPKIEEVATNAAADDFKGIKRMASKTLAEKAAMVPQLKAFISAVEGEVERRLLEGKKVKGKRLAKGNTRRLWKFSEETMVKKFADLKVPKTWQVVEKPRSVSEMEKLFKEKGRDPVELEKLIKKQEGGPIVVDENSTRQDYDTADNAKKDFESAKK
jgi:hypothetical protein